MVKLFKSQKFLYYLDLVLVCLIAFTYPSFSFRGGLPNILSLCIYGTYLVYLCFKIFLNKKLFIKVPTIALLLFIVGVIISTALNKDSSLSSSIILCTLLVLIGSLYFSHKADWLESFSIGYALGTIIFTFYLLAVSKFKINNLNTDYFVNLNRICATYAVSAIFLVIYLFNFQSKIILRIFSVIAIIIFSFFLVKIGSRGAFVAFLVVLVSNVLFKFWAKNKTLLIMILFIVLVTGITVVLSIPQLRNSFIRYFDFISFLGGSTNSDISSQERFNMQMTALYHFLESPLFGHGIDGFMNNGAFNVYSHNTFTELLCNFGIIGFLLYEIPLGYSIYAIFKAEHKTDKAILVSLLCYLIIIQFTSITILDKLSSLVYGVLIGKSISVRLCLSESYASECQLTRKESNTVLVSKEETIDDELLLKKANKSFKWSSLTEIIAKIVVPICNMILSRFIAPEIFGIVASISVITGLADVLADGGFTYLILHKKISDETSRKKFEGTISLINILVSSVLTVFIIIFSNQFAALVGAEGYGIYMIIAAIQIPFYGFSTIQLSICRREFLYNKVLLVRITSLFVQIFVTLILAFLGKGIEALILRGVIGAVSQTILIPFICRVKPFFCFSKEIFSGIWKLALFYLVDALIIWASSSVDTIMINNFFNQTVVGVFKNSITMENSIVTLLTAIYMPILIALFGQSSKDTASLKNHLFTYQKILSYILIPIGIGMFLYRDFISYLLLGAGWDGASWVIGILGLANILKTATGGFALIVFYATGKPLYATVTNFVGVSVKVAVYFIFGTLGFIPLIVGLTLPLVLMTAVSFVICRCLYKIPILPFFKNLVMPLLFCIPMAIVGLIQQYSLSGMLGNIIGVLFCIIVYFVIAFKFDKKNVLNLFNVVAGKVVS